jgi:hypothetical protein
MGMKTYTLDELNKKYRNRKVDFYINISQSAPHNWRTRGVPEYQINGVSGVIRENFENLEMINRRLR